MVGCHVWRYAGYWGFECVSFLWWYWQRIPVVGRGGIILCLFISFLVFHWSISCSSFSWIIDQLYHGELTNFCFLFIIHSHNIVSVCRGISCGGCLYRNIQCYQLDVCLQSVSMMLSLLYMYKTNMMCFMIVLISSTDVTCRSQFMAFIHEWTFLLHVNNYCWGKIC